MGRGTRIVIGLTALLASALCAAAQGGPPFYTNDPGTPGPRNWEINLGYMPFLYSNQSISHTPDVDINFGIGERIQLTYENAWLRVHQLPLDAKYGLGQSNFGVKWRFYDAGDSGWSISTFPQGFVNNPDDSVRRGITPQTNSFLLPFEFSHKLGVLDVDFELGYNFVHNGPSGWLAGVVVGHTFTPKLELDGEFYTQSTYNPYVSQPTLELGGRYRIHRPIVLLAAIVFVAGFFSAFFVNDTMCLVLTPLVVEITGQLRRNAVPYLLAVAMAANIGSVATITGNPQNMMIGSFSGIHYRTFAAALAPVAVVGLALTVAVIAAAYHREFRFQEKVALERRPVRVNRVLMWKSLAVSAGMIVFFFAGWPVSKVALMAGALLLVTRRVKPERIYREIDWSLLVLFIGLFIVVAGVEKTSLPGDLFRAAQQFHLERVPVLSALAAVLSNFVSNVPAVLVFKPFVVHMGNPVRSWLTLAMSTTLAGNLTILGSVANLIVVQRARHETPISFWQYFRVGAPLTALTIAVGALWLS